MNREAKPAGDEAAGAEGEPLVEGGPQKGSPGWLRYLSVKRISAIYLLAVFLVLFGLLVPETFLTDVTFRLVFSEGVVTCLVALAFLVPLVAGVYDLSVGAVMSFALAISVYLQNESGLPPGLGAVVAMIAAAAVGCLSGFVIVKLRVNSFIATLGVSQLLLALVLLLSNNQQLVGDFPDSWSNLGNSLVLSAPVVVLYLMAIGLLLWFVLEHTRIGRYLFAIGGNVEAARLSGVRTDRLIWGSLIASASIAGFAGVIYSMRTGVFTSTIGPGYLFPAVAAVFLGASQFSQRPNVWGTLIAYFTLAFGVQGLQLAASSASAWSRPLFEGVSLIVAVALASRPIAARVRRQRRATGLGARGPSA